MRKLVQSHISKTNFSVWFLKLFGLLSLIAELSAMNARALGDLYNSNGIRRS